MTVASLAMLLTALAASPLAPFRQCGQIVGAAERLACFDRALAAGEQARTAEIGRRRAGFGLSGNGPSNDDDVDAMASRVSSALEAVFADGGGKSVFLLANGQLWRETSNTTYRGAVRPGWPVEVRRGGIGGFRLEFSGRTGFFAVERLR